MQVQYKWYLAADQLTPSKLDYCSTTAMFHKRFSIGMMFNLISEKKTDEPYKSSKKDKDKEKDKDKGKDKKAVEDGASATVDNAQDEPDKKEAAEMLAESIADDTKRAVTFSN